MLLAPISSPGVGKGNIWLLICLKRLHSPSSGLGKVLISFPLSHLPWECPTAHTLFKSKVCSAAKLLSSSHGEEKGLEGTWRGPLAYKARWATPPSLRTDLFFSSNKLHVRSSTSPIQFTSENHPVVQPSLAVKLTTSHQVSHSCENQLIPLCFCPTSDIWRPLFFLEHSSRFWPRGHIFLEVLCAPWGVAPNSVAQAKGRRRFTKHIFQRTTQSIHTHMKTGFFFSQQYEIVAFCLFWDLPQPLQLPFGSFHADVLPGWISPLSLCLHCWLLQINLTYVCFFM